MLAQPASFAIKHDGCDFLSWMTDTEACTTAPQSQAWASRLAKKADSKQPTPTQVVQSLSASPAGPLPFEVTWMLLELVEALERGMYNAYEGSMQRRPFSWPITSFYAANRKVCLAFLDSAACGAEYDGMMMSVNSRDCWPCLRVVCPCMQH